jgi:hypothetical protein
MEDNTHMIDEKPLTADQLTRRIYVLLGRYHANDNLVTAKCSVSWELLAQAKDRPYVQSRLAESLFKEIAHKTAKHFPITKTKDPHGENYSTYGFIFAEEQLITLMYMIYQAGLENRGD